MPLLFCSLYLISVDPQTSHPCRQSHHGRHPPHQEPDPTRFRLVGVRIDAVCETKEEARELLDLYPVALAYWMLPFYRSKVQTFAYNREIDRDKAVHLLDVMHSLMVRSNNDGERSYVHLLSPSNRASTTDEAPCVNLHALFSLLEAFYLTERGMTARHR